MIAKKGFLCGIGAREGIVIRIGANVGNDGESGDGGEGGHGRNTGSLLLQVRNEKFEYSNVR